jgi:tetratricopeptide (TPR) repeat protein
MKSYSPSQPFFLILSFLLLFSVKAWTQGEEKLKSVFLEAESYFLFEEYKDALPLYQRVLAADPENYNVNYKIGVCYLNDIYQVSKSVPYLEKAVKGTSSESKTTSFKETKAPPEALYYLGNAYRANNKLKDAIEAYEQFKLVLDPLVYDIALVNEQITACKIAAEQQKKPMYFISANLGEGINDRFEEINPVISGDEKTLAFTRKLQFYDAVFISHYEKGSWTEPLNLTPFFGVDGNSYTSGLSYNGDEMIIYRSDNFDGNLYVSKYKGGKWSKLERLNSNINTKYWESHGAFSKDGKTLYFTSNREGGYGGLDIYKSERSRSGDWGPAVNLGPVINSKYNEDTPFITDDGATLYFSSMGHYNMGGYDIFYSTRFDNGQWSKPVNAGYPLNTTNDDMFFVPVMDGAYAYYSKYDPDDSYGMADIYKLEVFTDLHPRKFILNGIARVDGQVNANYSQYVASLINSKTGKVIDQSKLNPDGTYTLNALSGEYELKIKGNGIEESSEKISIAINNPSNIIAHSSVLTASASDAVASQIPVVSKPVTEAGPIMSVAVSSYNVTTNEAIPIRLDLERNTTLKVARLVNGKLVKKELFDIKRKRFVYMLTPEPGVNTLHLTLINSKGDSTVHEIVVTFTPLVEEMPALPPVKTVVLSDSDKYLGIPSMTSGKLQEYLKTLNLQGQFKSIADLYDFLLKNAPEQGFSIQDVENLMKRFLSQKDLNLFYDEIMDHASDSITSALQKTNLKENNIYTSESLLDFLYGNAGKTGYNLEELRNTLYRIASLSRDPNELISLFESYASGDLAKLLGEMLQNRKSFSDTKSVADHIIKAAENNLFPLSELDAMLKLAAADMNVHFLSQGLIFISSENLKQTLLTLNMDTQGIRNSMELISFLLNSADKQGYSKRELLENIEKIRRDPYYFVDLFRKMLAEKATGSLKEFLQEIDIRNLKLNTFEDLINYLLNQSQFHDYNREMVYQLLIDIIDPKNIAEFINLLKQYADGGIIRAIDATDTRQFSRPIEVMQYLLSVAGEYDYTEQDLLRVLLKMLLRKGPSSGIQETAKGWFSGLERPVLVTSLIVVNGIIILLLILFLLRKKRKNE